MSAALAGLRDIVGVQGSLLAAAGNVIAHDLPGVPPDVCGRVAARLDAMLATVDENFEPLELMKLDFEGVDLFVRRSGDNAILVLASAKTNVEALKMATKLVLRRMPVPGAAVATSEPLMPLLPPPTSSAPFLAVPVSLPRAPPPPATTPTGPLPVFVPSPSLKTVSAPIAPAAGGATRPRPSEGQPTSPTKKKSDIWG